jgi:hypothetical protein
MEKRTSARAKDKNFMVLGFHDFQKKVSESSHACPCVILGHRAPWKSLFDQIQANRIIRVIVWENLLSLDFRKR